MLCFSKLRKLYSTPAPNSMIFVSVLLGISSLGCFGEDLLNQENHDQRCGLDPELHDPETPASSFHDSPA